MVRGASAPEKIALEMAFLNIGVLPTVAIYRMITGCVFRLMMQLKSGDNGFVRQGEAEIGDHEANARD
jgi:hypothetical protein